MPAGKRRSLRRSGSVVAFGFVCLAWLAPGSDAASSPTPDPPPLAVAPDLQPAGQPAGAVAAPPRPREAPAVVQAPAAQSVAPAAAPAVKPAPAVVQKPVVQKPAPRAKKTPKRTSAPVSSPARVALPTHFAPRDVPRGAVAVPEVEAIPRGRVALAGVALALVAVGGGVILGVGRRALLAVSE